MILVIAVIIIGMYFLLEQLFKSAWGGEMDEDEKTYSGLLEDED